MTILNYIDKYIEESKRYQQKKKKTRLYLGSQTSIISFKNETPVSHRICLQIMLECLYGMGVPFTSIYKFCLGPAQDHAKGKGINIDCEIKGS